MTTAEIMEPGADWCHLHQGPFRFFPSPATTPEAVQSSLVERATRVRDRSGFSLKIYPDYDFRIICEAERFNFEIDGEAGEFALSTKGEDDFAIIREYPRRFVENTETKLPGWMTSEERECIRTLAAGLWSIGAHNIKTALRQKRARIMARVGSPISPFQHIPLDAWSTFKSRLRDEDCDVDDRIWDAAGPGGICLYSVWIAPCDQAELAKSIALKSTEKKCLRWLVQKMKQSSIQTTTRKILFDEARKEFPGLLGAGFDRVWKDAIAETGATEWSSKGRRRKPQTKTLTQLNVEVF